MEVKSPLPDSYRDGHFLNQAPETSVVSEGNVVNVRFHWDFELE